MPNEKELDENSNLTLQKAVFRFQTILRQGVPKIGSITDILIISLIEDTYYG